MGLPNPTPIIELIYAFRLSKTMFAAVSMGIFDRLGDSSADVATLARDLNSNVNSLQQLLDGCVGLGLLEKRDGQYSNSSAAKTYLIRSSPNTLAGYVTYSDRALYPMWGNLESAIREGSNRWEQTFGGKEGVFENIFRTEESRREFLSGMDGFGQLSSPAIIAAFDLGLFHRFVDLGGGTGHLVLNACTRYPDLHGVLFDLPGAIHTAGEFLKRSPPGAGIERVSGDFFNDPLPAADIFALGRIIHDWSEDKVRLLLGKIWQKLPSGGALLIAEKLLNEAKSGPVPALMQSLSMLICTEGKERTFAEYSALLRDAGFTKIESKVTDSPLDAILAIKD